MSDLVILDTNVFLNLLAGAEVEGQVYQKIIRRCDRVAIQSKLIEEYQSTLKRKFPGLVEYIIETRFAELRAHRKLVRARESEMSLLDIDEEDRHVICAAKSVHARYVITTDRRHLWGQRDHIQASHHIVVLRPEEYLKLDG